MILKFNIIYGGSVNPKNAVQLFASESLDGVLIGRASINIDEFPKFVLQQKIVNYKSFDWYFLYGKFNSIVHVIVSLL